MIYYISNILKDSVSVNKSTLKTTTFKLRFIGVMNYGVKNEGILLQITIF